MEISFKDVAKAILAHNMDVEEAIHVAECVRKKQEALEYASIVNEIVDKIDRAMAPTMKEESCTDTWVCEAIPILAILSEYKKKAEERVDAAIIALENTL